MRAELASVNVGSIIDGASRLPRRVTGPTHLPTGQNPLAEHAHHAHPHVPHWSARRAHRPTARAFCKTRARARAPKGPFPPSFHGTLAAAYLCFQADVMLLGAQETNLF
eukprot:6052045-Prymnesium_polylepis.2